jgi:hypothetical protein
MYNVLQKERELYEYIINKGKVIHKQSREPLDASQGPEGAKWIFVMSTARKLYAGKVPCLHFKGFYTYNATEPMLYKLF